MSKYFTIYKYPIIDLNNKKDYICLTCNDGITGGYVCSSQMLHHYILHLLYGHTEQHNEDIYYKRKYLKRDLISFLRRRRTKDYYDQSYKTMLRSIDLNTVQVESLDWFKILQMDKYNASKGKKIPYPKMLHGYLTHKLIKVGADLDNSKHQKVIR